MRIFTPRRSLPRSELARLTQIDYDREMAFIAERARARRPARDDRHRARDFGP